MKTESRKVVVYIVQSNKLLVGTLLWRGVLTFPKTDVGLVWAVSMPPLLLCKVKQDYVIDFCDMCIKFDQVS